MFLRGVSGGERKRVTTTEMLVGPRRIMFLDEISTGLDSATLYSIISLLGKVGVLVHDGIGQQAAGLNHIAGGSAIQTAGGVSYITFLEEISSCLDSVTLYWIIFLSGKVGVR